MAVQTGTGQAQHNSGLTKEQLELVEKAKKPMEIANKCRLFFLFIAVLGLLFVYFGGKLWTGTGWYEQAVQKVYQFLLWDILLMLLSTFIKFFFAARYNRVVKRL